MTMGTSEAGKRKRQLQQGLQTIARIFSTITKRRIKKITFTNQREEKNDVREEDIPDLVSKHRFANVTQLEKALKDRILDPLVNNRQLSKPLLIVTITDCKVRAQSPEAEKHNGAN
jgi:hypothetical protein